MVNKNGMIESQSETKETFFETSQYLGDVYNYREYSYTLADAFVSSHLHTYLLTFAVKNVLLFTGDKWMKVAIDYLLI